jgi:hypothetical protein
MVLVVAQHHLLKLDTDLGRTVMPPALKLSLKGFKFRHHPLLRRNPPDDKGSVAVALLTEIGETQEREGLWFPVPAASGLGRQTVRIRSVSAPVPIARQKLASLTGAEGKGVQ